MAETDVVAVLASALSCTFYSRTGLNHSVFAFLGSCDGQGDSKSVSPESVQINTDQRLSAMAKDVCSGSFATEPFSASSGRCPVCPESESAAFDGYEFSPGDLLSETICEGPRGFRGRARARKSSHLAAVDFPCRRGCPRAKVDAASHKTRGRRTARQSSSDRLRTLPGR